MSCSNEKNLYDRVLENLSVYFPEEMAALNSIELEGIFLSGQAVAQCYLEMVGSDIKTAINDLDIFVVEKSRTELLSLFGHQMVASDMGLNRQGKAQYQMATSSYDDGLCPVYKSEYTILSSGVINKANITCIKTYSGAHSIAECILDGFDLNCSQVCLDLTNEKLVVSDAFLDFIKTKQLKVVSTVTPAPTYLRLKQKIRDFKNVYCNEVREVSKIQLALAACQKGRELTSKNYHRIGTSLGAVRFNKLVEEFPEASELFTYSFHSFIDNDGYETQLCSLLPNFRKVSDEISPWFDFIFNFEEDHELWHLELIASTASNIVEGNPAKLLQDFYRASQSTEPYLSGCLLLQSKIKFDQLSLKKMASLSTDMLAPFKPLVLNSSSAELISKKADLLIWLANHKSYFLRNEAYFVKSLLNMSLNEMSAYKLLIEEHERLLSQENVAPVLSNVMQIDDVSIREVTDKLELYSLGESQNHCVGNYWSRLSVNTIICTLENKNGFSMAALSLVENNKSYRTEFQIIEIRAKNNTRPHESHILAIEKLTSQLNETNDITRIGKLGDWRPIKKLEYIVGKAKDAAINHFLDFRSKPRPVLRILRSHNI